MEDDHKEFSSIEKSFNEGAFEHSLTTTITSYINSLEGIRTTQLENNKKRKTELEKELPPSLVKLTEQVEHAKNIKKDIEDYKGYKSSLEKVKTKLKHFSEWKQFMDKVANKFGSAETRLSQEKIAEIESEYKEVFAQIIPNVDVVPSLKKPSDSEALHVELERFHGVEDKSARALLSESYRNALAISVFSECGYKNSKHASIYSS